MESDAMAEANADQTADIVVSSQPGSKRMQVAVVIPALNEAASIGRVLQEMPWTRIAECIVVDNGSSDNTGEIARAAGARTVFEPRRGYGSACKAGVNSVGPATEIVVFMDGDGADVISELDELIGPIEQDEADFVIGSRIAGEREPGSMLPSQLFAGHLVSALLRLIYRVNYTDMGPFRAIRRASLLELNMSEMTYGWNLEMQIKACQYGLRIREIPVRHRRRFGGSSKVSGDIRASIRAAVRILEVLIRTVLRGKPARNR